MTNLTPRQPAPDAAPEHVRGPTMEPQLVVTFSPHCGERDWSFSQALRAAAAWVETDGLQRTIWHGDIWQAEEGSSTWGVTLYLDPEENGIGNATP